MVFSCILGVGTPDEIKWYRDGKLLSPAEGRIEIERLPNGECRLTISDCSIADEGIYRCEASNTFGTAKTQATGHVDSGCF